MKSFIFIAKLASFIFLFSVTIISIVIILFLFSNLPQSYAKNWLESYLQNTLSINANFQSLRGNIYDSIIIENIQILDSNHTDAYDVVSIQKASLSFNIFKLIFYTDKLQSINHLNLDGVDYYIIRDANGKWRHVSLTATTHNNNQFLGNIFINNFSLHYHDYRGWKKEPLIAPFQTTIEQLSGTLKFNNPHKGILNLEGQLMSSGKPFVIAGYITPSSKDYLIQFDTPSMLINKWGSYVIPQNGFSNMQGSASMTGYITSKKYPTDAKLPFWYDISFEITNGTILTPFLDSLISSANGTLTISQGIFDADFFRSMKPYLSASEAKKLESTFKENGFTDSSFCLTNQVPTGIKSRQLHPKTHIQRHIETTLLNPKFLLTFNDISGNVSSIPVTFNGTLNLNDRWIELAFNSDHADSAQLEVIFPALDILSLKHPANIDLSIFGNLNNPITKGSFYSDKIRCFNQDFTDVHGKFKFYNNVFDLNLEKGIYYDSLLAGNLRLNNLMTSPHINSQFFLSDLSLTSVVDASVITGNIDISLTLIGPVTTITGNIDVLSTNTSFFNQSLNAYNGSILITANAVTISSGNLYINDSISPLLVDLSLSSDYLEITASGNDILFFDPLSNFSKNSSFLNLNGYAIYPLHQTQLPYFPNQGFLNANLVTPYLNNQRYDQLATAIKFNTTHLSLENLTLHKNDSNLLLSGTLSPDLTSSFDLSINNIDTGIIPYINSVIPQAFSPFSATIKKCSTTLTYSKRKGLSGNGHIDLAKVDLKALSFDSINSEVSFSNHMIVFNSLNLFKDKSIMNLKGNFNINDPSLSLDIMYPSKFNLSLLSSFYDDPLSISGETMVSGNFSYSPNRYTLNGNITAPTIMINNISFLDNLANITLSNTTFTIHTLKTNIDKGSLLLTGRINHYNFRDFSYRLNSTFNNVPIFKLQKVSLPFNSAISNSLSYNQSSLDDLTISSPFNKEASIVLLSPFSSQSEYDFIQSINSHSKKTSSQSFRLPKLLDGYLSGNLSINKESAMFPMLDGAISFSNFSTHLLDAKSIDISLTPKDESTHFLCSFNHGFLNQYAFKNSFISGSISKEYQLSINKTHFSGSDFAIQDFLSGTLSIPHSQSRSPHGLDLYLNLSHDNMSIIPLLFNSISDLDYTGELLLHVSGSLENPFINTLVNSDHDLSLNLSSQKSYHVKAPSFLISDNVLDFPKLMIAPIHSNPSSSQNNNETSFSGTITLNSFDLTNFESIISSVNIFMSDQSFAVSNSFLNGDVSMTDTSLSGTLITPLNGDNPLQFYDSQNTDLPNFKSTIQLSDSEISFSKKQKPFPIPVFLDLKINISDNVLFSGPILGNSFFGISADLDFDKTDSPLLFRGPLHNLEISNQLPISTGSLTIFNRNFEILIPSHQQIYANNGSIVLNGINMANTLDPNGNTLITPLLSLKSLYVRENDMTVTDNESLPYTHIVMTIDDTLSSIGNIYFDIFESVYESPNNISELTFIKQYAISNQNILDSNLAANSDITELLQLLIPEIYLDDSVAGFQTIGETQINTLIRRSILRPLEKNLAKQIGLNDLKINYNLGEKIIAGTDSTLGLQFMKHILSDRLILNLSTQMDLSEDNNSNQANSMELSEIKLSYYLLKNKNLSLNYSNYKNQLDNADNYLSKFSMRYDYEY
ncbi:hypothetical protein CL647_04515 [bacterium]|nr:hypothetical protein [bacterium]